MYRFRFAKYPLKNIRVKIWLYCVLFLLISQSYNRDMFFTVVLTNFEIISVLFTSIFQGMMYRLSYKLWTTVRIDWSPFHIFFSQLYPQKWFGTNFHLFFDIFLLLISFPTKFHGYQMRLQPFFNSLVLSKFEISNRLLILMKVSQNLVVLDWFDGLFTWPNRNLFQPWESPIENTDKHFVIEFLKIICSIPMYENLADLCTVIRRISIIITQCVFSLWTNLLDYLQYYTYIVYGKILKSFMYFNKSVWTLDASGILQS